MTTRIVETVTGRTLAELRAARDRVCDADLVELRLDHVADIDVPGALAGRTRPVIVTCRAAWEGGHFTGSEEERLRILGEAIACGAEYVDVEWRADRRALPPAGRTQLVLSHHVFSDTPADLAERVRAMRAEQPAVMKIAVTAERLTDCIRLRAAAAGDGASVLIAMGMPGLATRLLPAHFGSIWTYGGAAASGQMPVHVLNRRFRVRETTSATRVYGIAGSPIGHSASPAMHNAGFSATGIDAVYVPLETNDADDFLKFADGIGLAGASVTVPLKRDIAGRVSSARARTGPLRAVNTIRRTATGLEAENFDVDGFLAPFDRRAIDLNRIRAVVLGAGGAADAVVMALVSRGARVAVSARRASKAADVAGALGVETTPWPPKPGWDLLVNATTAGMSPRVDESPIERALVRGPRVYDLIYNPPETTLLRWAREAGADTIGGLEMLVGQGCRQFEWWTGTSVPAAVLDAAAREFLAEHTADGVDRHQMERTGR